MEQLFVFEQFFVALEQLFVFNQFLLALEQIFVFEQFFLALEQVFVFEQFLLALDGALFDFLTAFCLKGFLRMNTYFLSRKGRFTAHFIYKREKNWDSTHSHKSKSSIERRGNLPRIDGGILDQSTGYRQQRKGANACTTTDTEIDKQDMWDTGVGNRDLTFWSCSVGIGYRAGNTVRTH